jgi:poly(A) polymerase
MIINIPQTESQLIQEILRFLNPSESHQVWLVGGMIRDIIHSKKECYDIDLALNFNPFKQAREYARFTNSGVVILDEERHIIRVVRTLDNGKVYTFDLSQFRANNIDDDLKARDFTINAISAPLFGKNINFLKENKVDLYDPLNGTIDLKNNIIKECSENLFKDDPLRIMRAFRFSAIFNSSLSKELINLIKQDKELLQTVSGERIRDELFKILSVSQSFKWIHLLDETAVLKILLPELDICHGITQNEWHHLDVFNHSILSLEKLETLSTLKPPYPWWKEFEEYLHETISVSRNYLQLLKFGTLIHDIGKVPCKNIDLNTGKISFHRHEVEGAKMVKDICERLRLSCKELTYLQNVIKNHMRPGIMIQQGINEKRLFRFYSECGRDGLGICLMCLADRFSALGDNVSDQDLSIFSAGIYQIMNEFYIQKQMPKIKPFLNGNDIMQLLDLKPGPIIKVLIDSLEESQFTGEVTTKEEAETFIKKYYNLRYKI